MSVDGLREAVARVPAPLDAGTGPSKYDRDAVVFRLRRANESNHGFPGSLGGQSSSGIVGCRGWRCRRGGCSRGREWRPFERQNCVAASANASTERIFLENAKLELATNFCISVLLRGNRPARICSQPGRGQKFTSRLGSFLGTLACRGGIPEMFAVLAQQELVRHSRDVVADGDVPRFPCALTLMAAGMGPAHASNSERVLPKRTRSGCGLR